MYGRKKYGRMNKQDIPVPPEAIPNYICGHCGGIKTTAAPFIDITAMSKGKLFVYTKICDECSKLFKEWTGK